MSVKSAVVAARKELDDAWHQKYPDGKFVIYNAFGEWHAEQHLMRSTSSSHCARQWTNQGRIKYGTSHLSANQKNKRVFTDKASFVEAAKTVGIYIEE
jgi:hypothetical protein